MAHETVLCILRDFEANRATVDQVLTTLNTALKNNGYAFRAVSPIRLNVRDSEKVEKALAKNPGLWNFEAPLAGEGVDIADLADVINGFVYAIEFNDASNNRQRYYFATELADL